MDYLIQGGIGIATVTAAIIAVRIQIRHTTASRMWEEINLKLHRGEFLHKTEECGMLHNKILVALGAIYGKLGGNPADLNL